ncbi:MAG: glycosyltransferase [Bacilli bacterium]|nr:glycosyltransferase [Bacilli bacterium]
MNNIFYFKKISKIGGTEQFLYEIAKKYYMYDITIFYDEADIYQVKRLRQLVRCRKRIKGEKVKCKRAFLNFNLDMINDIEAEEYYFVSHANYEELHRVHGGYIPPIKNDKLTHYIGVSQFAADKLDEYAKLIGSKIKTQRCYNPLTLEPKEKVVHLVSAGRIDDEVKGGGRTLKLIDALDRYCERTGRHYIWTIFTNPTNNVNTLSPNVALMRPRVDVRPYIADADYVLQLSNDMETYCYTVNEALGYGVPVVTTPLSILKELPITDNEHLVLEYDCSNVDEIARQIFEKEVKPFKYNPPADSWEDFIIKEKSIYEEEKKMKYLVEATSKYEITNTSDNELSDKNGKRYVPKRGEQWEVSFERKEHLLELGFVTVIKEIDDKPKADVETEAEPKKKTTKKTTKK